MRFMHYFRTSVLFRYNWNERNNSFYLLTVNVTVSMRRPINKYRYILLSILSIETHLERVDSSFELFFFEILNICISIIQLLFSASFCTVVKPF